MSNPTTKDQNDDAYRKSIAKLNDQLRNDPLNTSYGTFVVTRGVIALGEDDAAEAVKTMAEFTDFTNSNDPYGEHDCATFQIKSKNGNKLTFTFKIDYYDKSYEYQSPDPSDSAETARVLTLMLSNEY